MSELGRDARSVLLSARAAHDPAAGAKERVRAGLVAALSASATAGAGGAVAMAPAGAGARSAWLSAAKMVTVIAIAGGGAWLLFGGGGSKSGPHGATGGANVGVPVEPAVASPVTAGPGTARATAPSLAVGVDAPPSAVVVTAATTVATAATGAPSRAPVAALPRQPSSQASEGSVAAEVAILQRVSAALRAGDPTRALAAVAEHARRFPTGALAEERDTERIVALCALGRKEDAARARGRFERAYPSSSHEARLQSACAAAGAGP